MVENFDAGIARRTLEAYEPATPPTFGSLVVAALLGCTGTHLVAWPFRRRSRLRMQGARAG